MTAGGKKRSPSNLCIILIEFILLIILAPGCTVRKEFRQGDQAFRNKDWDRAVQYFLKVVGKDPGNVGYRISLSKALISASNYHLQQGKLFVSDSRLRPALVEFEKSIDYNPENNEAREQKRRLLKRLRELEKEQREKTEIETLKEKAAVEEPAEPDVKFKKKPYTLKFVRTDLAQVFSALEKSSGVHFIFDEAFKSQKIALNLEDVYFLEALKKIMLQAKLFYKVIDDHTVMVIPDTPAKRKEHEEQVMKTIFLSNGDPDNIQKIVQSLTGMKSIAPDKDLDSLTVTGTPAEVKLAEKIIRTHDKPKGELFLDIEIIEVNRTRARDYGIELSQYQVTETYSPETGSDTTPTVSTIRLNMLSHTDASDYLLTLPSINYKLLRTDRNSRIKARPQLRVVDRERVKVRLGDKVPIPTTTFVPYNTAGPAQQPITSYQMQDIGINIDLTPHIHHDGLVTLKLEFELTFITNPGTERLPPTIGNRSVTTMIKLRDNETGILAGLLRDTERKSLQGFPVLSQLPVLKEIFSSNQKEIEQTDIILTLTPRIIRFPEVLEEDMERVWSGTAQRPELKTAPPFLHVKEEEPREETSKPGTAPATTMSTEKTPAVVTPETTTPAVAATTQTEVPRPMEQLVIKLQVPVESITVGKEFPVALVMAGKGDVKIIKIQMQIDPKVVQVKEISEGKWLKEKDARINLFKTFDNQIGKIIINFTMDTPPGEGQKELAVIHFRSLAEGSISLNSPVVFEVLDSNLKKTGAAFSGATIRVVE